MLRHDTGGEIGFLETGRAVGGICRIYGAVGMLTPDVTRVLADLVSRQRDELKILYVDHMASRGQDGRFHMPFAEMHHVTSEYFFTILYI